MSKKISRTAEIIRDLYEDAAKTMGYKSLKQAIEDPNAFFVKIRRQSLEPKERVLEIERIYQKFSEECMCSRQDGEFCYGCSPDTDDFEWLISQVKVLLK